LTIRLVQHIPTFCEGFDPKHADIETVEDLGKVEWIRSWSESPGFHRYSWSSITPGGRGHLMAELHGGNEFYVIAFAGEPIPGLPEWEETDLARQQRHAWNRGDLKEVHRLEAKIRGKGGA